MLIGLEELESFHCSDCTFKKTICGGLKLESDWICSTVQNLLHVAPNLPLAAQRGLVQFHVESFKNS